LFIPVFNDNSFLFIYSASRFHNYNKNNKNSNNSKNKAPVQGGIQNGGEGCHYYTLGDLCDDTWFGRNRMYLCICICMYIYIHICVYMYTQLYEDKVVYICISIYICKRCKSKNRFVFIIINFWDIFFFDIFMSLLCFYSFRVF
jgi:uncharacterized membrane protein